MAAPPSPRLSVPIEQALAASDPLARLTQRLRASEDCLARLRPCLPQALFAQLRPGPIDDEGWTLLTPNGAVAAKVRQLLPVLLAQLADGGGPAPRAIKVRILSGS